MSIEEDVFRKRKVKEDALISYGFKKKESYYSYSKEFMNHNMKAEIVINEVGIVTGKVYDLDMEEEYTNFRIEGIVGDFANTVKEEYQNILQDIATHCFIEEEFMFEQSNRISRKIKEKYHIHPEFLWEKFPNYGIFRNEKSDKWFAIIMNLNRSKFRKEEEGIVEVLNVKLEDKVEENIKRKGIYPAYHSNKKNWVSIILDDTLTDEEVMDLISISYDLSDITGDWIIPANPNYYDIIGAFEKTDTMDWKQPSSVQVGDMVYIYMAKPYSAILFQCEVVEINIPTNSKNSNYSISYDMKLRLVKKYDKEKWPLEKLKEYGVKAIRSPRRIPKTLSQELR